MHRRAVRTFWKNAGAAEGIRCARHVDFLATEVLFFGGLFLTYHHNRHASAPLSHWQQHS